MLLGPVHCQSGLCGEMQTKFKKKILKEFPERPRPPPGSRGTKKEADGTASEVRTERTRGTVVPPGLHVAAEVGAPLDGLSAPERDEPQEFPASAADFS